MKGEFSRYVFIPLVQLVKADWNYKDDDEKKLEKLIANLKHNGQVQNIIVRELGAKKYEVVNGNHRFDALVANGVDGAVCCNLGKISKNAAIRVAVETNETNFDSDSISLARVIENILKEFELEDVAVTMPYDEEQLAMFQNLIDNNWSAFDRMPEGYDEEFHLLKFKVDEKHLAIWSQVKTRLKNKISEEQVFIFAIDCAIIQLKKSKKN